MLTASPAFSLTAVPATVAVAARACLAMLWALGALILMPPCTAFAQAPVMVEKVSEMPTKWRNDRQLYIKGRVNINPARLREIATFLRDKAPNWTVVIADNVDSEVYTDASGRELRGRDAANAALGYGLRGNANFAQLEDTRMRKSNGAILFFLQRNAEGKSDVVYYDNEAQRAAGVGENAWTGNLDAPALNALADGARYQDAVRNTIGAINEAVEVKGRAEQATWQKLRDDATIHLNHAEWSLEELDHKVQTMIQQNPRLRGGDILRPPIETFRNSFKALEARLDEAPYETGRNASMLASRIVDALVDIENYDRDVRLMDETTLEVKNFAQSKAEDIKRVPAAAEKLRETEESLKQAQEAYDRGDRSYRNALTLTKKKLDETQTALTIAGARPALPGAYLVIGGIVVLFAALGAVAFVLISANQPIQQRAQQLLRQRETELTHVPARALDLVDSARFTIGADADTEMRFQGKTLDEARDILREVDGIYLDASAAAQQVARAKALLGGDSVTGALAMFSSAPHWEAEGLLHNDVTVRPDAPPKLLTRKEKASTRAPGGDHSALISGHLLGNARDQHPHTFAWQHFTEQLDERAAKTDARLMALSQSLQAPAVEIARIRTELDAVAAARPEAPVPVLRAAHVFDTLIPAARAACLAAEEKAVRDPITAMEEMVPDASRMAAQARRLVEITEDLREKKAPRLLKIAEFLKQHKIRDSWVRTGLSDLDARIEQLAQEAVTRDIADDLKTVEETGADLLARADGAVASLAALNKLHGDREQRAASLPQARTALAEKIGAALAESKGRTAPDAEATLKEPGREAERFLRVAEAQLDIARGALMNGDTPAALHAVEIGDEALASFDDSITQSTEAAATFMERKAALRGEARLLLAEAPRATAILDYLQKNFHPGALVLPEAPDDANATITDNIGEFEAAMRRTAELLAAAEANLAKAAPFKASAQLDQAATAIQAGRVRLSEITTTAGELRAADGRNAESLSLLQQRFAALESGLGQRIATPATRTLGEEIRAALGRVAEEAAALPRNPTAIAKTIAELEVQATVLEARLLADQETHDEMLQALRSAEAHLVPARDTASAFKVEQATYPDEARAAIAGIEAAQRRFNAARQSSRDDHADWAAIVEELNAVSIETARHMAVLRGNTETASHVLVAVESAGKAVLRAVTYVGPRGVRIPTAPGSASVSTTSGSHDLANAHSLLSLGQLANSAVTAARALHQAEAALREAEAKVRRDDYDDEQQKLAARARFEDLQKQREWRKGSTPSKSPGEGQPGGKESTT
ncbi:hypothetical protein DB346_16800 [Verrucomicrobia bacterium LW23]|nr:hypothetical protein DB346_16800 [Verrucomicrobia bacterium LW23]